MRHSSHHHISVKLARVLAGGVAALAALLALAAPPASAAQPWWHLASTSAPTQLQEGSGANEALEVKVSATEGAFYLVQHKPFKYAELPWDATHEEVQAGLEKIYGAGNVEVTGGPGDETASHPYEIAWGGALADTPIETLEAFDALGCAQASGPNCKGQATVTVKHEGRPDGRLLVTATNLGDGAVESGASSPVTIVDRLPAGVNAISASGVSGWGKNSIQRGSVSCTVENPHTVACTYEGTLPPYEELEIEIGVILHGAESGEENEVTLAGGNAPRVEPLRRPIAVGGPASFGVAAYELLPEEASGATDTQAGSHPYQLTTELDLDRGAEVNHPPGLPKDLDFRLPPGLLGNPTPFPQCTEAQFTTEPSVDGPDECPNKTAVGVASITFALGSSVFKQLVPLFNLVPSTGEPARFGFSVEGKRVYLYTSVRTGDDYGVTVKVDSITPEATFLANRVTFWGVPGDASHDSARGWSCIAEGAFAKEAEAIGLGACSPADEHSPPPLLSLPTSCTGPLQSSVEADSWEAAGSFATFGLTAPMSALDGCERLPFSPALQVVPDVQDASSPSGLTVDLRVPQQLVTEAEALSESAVKATTVTLPAGVTVNPGGGQGLEACSEAQVGYLGAEAPGEDAVAAFSPTLPSPFCPSASKLGTVKIVTPLLPNPLQGAVYLATPAPGGEAGTNPFRTLLALYIVAEDPVSGTLVKLPGRVSLNNHTGQLTTTFENTPQLPFEMLELHFFGGGRAPLATPALCGSYSTTATITPWSGNPPSEVSSTFQITSGPNGGACDDPRPFAPEFQTGVTNLQAGEFSELRTTMGHPDSNQVLGGLQVTLPPGLLGMISSVKPCEEPQAAQGDCGPASLIGHTVVTAGLGSDPAVVPRPGDVYITGPYDGAPYGLTIVNPAEVGPFDLGDVVVRAKVEVNPTSAQLTITSAPLPTIIDGVPLNLQHVQVTIDRPGFTFNPTDCEKLSVAATLTSGESSATASAGSPFQVTNCARLGFEPTLSASASGKVSRLDGTRVAFTFAFPQGAVGHQAWLSRVKFSLPKQIPSRLTTLQKACPAATFDADPASCPAASQVGTAVVHTEVLPVPLQGPVYFVSNGGAKFPEAVLVLQGNNVTIDVHAETFISEAGITSVTVHEIPGVPFETTTITLPAGPFSAFTANTGLCPPTRIVAVRRRVTKRVHGHLERITRRTVEHLPTTLSMPVEMAGQNGAQIKMTTKMTVSGCAKARKATRRHRQHKHTKRHGQR